MRPEDRPQTPKIGGYRVQNQLTVKVRDLDALGYLGRLSTLLRWHEQDPPDAFERARNDAIFETWQGNRNPFVDRPEWVAAIW